MKRYETVVSFKHPGIKQEEVSQLDSRSVVEDKLTQKVCQHLTSKDERSIDSVQVKVAWT